MRSKIPLNFPRPAREIGLDVAKGIAVLLVMLHHTWQLMAASGWDLTWWRPVDTALTTLRMPLFFTVSGVLAARVRQLGFAELFRRRLALLLYLYLLWCAIRSIWFSAVPWPIEQFDAVGNFVFALIWPTNGLWYLYALVLFTVVAWVTQRIPDWITLSVAALASLAMASSSLTTGNWVWDLLVIYVPFFLAGMMFRRVILSRVKTAPSWLPGMVLIAYLLIEGWVVVLGARAAILTRIPLSVLGVVAGLLVASQLARILVGGWLALIGQRTLPVYLQHVLILSLLVWLVPLVVPGAIGFVIFPVVAVGLSLLLYRLLDRIPGIYRLPFQFRKRFADQPRQAGEQKSLNENHPLPALAPISED